MVLINGILWYILLKPALQQRGSPSPRLAASRLRQGVGAGLSNVGIVNWGINALKNI